MYQCPADVYDLIYEQIGKNYANQVDHLHELIQTQKRSERNTLLDVACGTGAHIEFFQQHYAVEGLDLDEAMLSVAREKFPDIPLHHYDMTNFSLDRSFDAVVCLFSAIGYVQTLEKMQAAIQCMANHVFPGGVLIVEPWLKPEDYIEGMVHATHIDQPELKITRTNNSRREGHLSIMDFHYLIGTPKGVRHFVETHTLGMFTHEAYVDAFRQAGMGLLYDDSGLTGRGLYVGQKPL